MKVTRAHYDFWCYKKTDIKLFAELQTKIKPNIHYLIPHEKARCSVLHNTIVVLKMARKRNNMLNLLVEMSVNPQCVDGAKRRTYCLRWLRKIQKADKRSLAQ